MKISKILITASALALSMTQLVAVDQTFQIDSDPDLTLSGNFFSVKLTGLTEGAVTFDATLSVTGSGDFTQASTGLGVKVDSSDLVSNGEFMFFTMAISNEVGGSISFDGFTELDYNSFGATDVGALSLDNNIVTAGDNFFTTSTGGDNVDISGTLPSSFYAIASADGAGSNSFRIDDVTARFTVVPEPDTYALLSGFCALGFVMLRRRK